MEPTLRRIGLYRRSYRIFSHDTKQRYDQFDNKPLVLTSHLLGSLFLL